MMSYNDYSAYTEAVYDEQEDGTCKWLGRVYNRKGPAKILETQDGIAGSRAEALKQAKAWSSDVLEQKYKNPEPPELVVVTADDVAVLDVAELNLED
jgi:hypothetical protein